MFKNCIQCKKEFKTDDKRRKFCSTICYHQYRKKHPDSNFFKKGQIAWNKGKKGKHFSPETEFKKGLIPYNKQPIGTITIRKQKGGIKRQFIKVAEPNQWINYSNYVWIKAGGNIPKGFYLHHINNNPLDDRIENLSLVTRSTHINIHRKQLTKNSISNVFP